MEGQMKERRRRDRIKLRRTLTPLEAEFDVGHVKGSGRVAKMSRAGCFVSTDQVPNALDSGSLVLFDETGSKVEVYGTVRRSSQGQRGRGFFLEIEGDSPEYADLYERMLVE